MHLILVTLHIMKSHISYLLAVVGTAALSSSVLFGGAVVSGFDSSSLPANDDGSTGLVAFGLSGPLNFSGTHYSGAYLNNNGNMTFGAALSIFTPFGITGGSIPMIAPFFADVDTRTGPLMQFGNGTFDGHAAFGQTWREVGYYSEHLEHRNTFQTLLVDRSDVAAGDFDIYFNYDTITWETGEASGSDANGLGGSSAHAGYTNGDGAFYELPGSGVNGAFLDGGVNALSSHSLNSDVTGRYIFSVRNGEVIHTTPDAGSSLALLGLALAALAATKRKLT